MQRLEDALDSMASRGDYAGAEELIERLEQSLASDIEGPGLVVTPVPARPTRSDSSWVRGVVVAAATMFVILGLAVGGIMVTGLFDTSGDLDVATPPTTSMELSEPDPSELFEGVVVAEQQTVSIVGDERTSSELIVECCVSAALPDLRGGVVYQLDSDRILWSRESGNGLETPALIVEAGAGETISLESASLLGGEMTVVFLREVADRIILSTVKLETGRFEEVAELGQDVYRVSGSESLLVVSHLDGADSWFEFRDASGEIVEVPGNPRPNPADSLVTQGVLSPSGDTMVFIERSRSDVDGGLADFVVWDIEEGSEVSRHRFAGLGDRIVAFDGERIVVLRQSASPANPPIMVAFHLTANLTLSSTGSIGPTEP